MHTVKCKPLGLNAVVHSSPNCHAGEAELIETHLLKHILFIQPVLFTHLGTDLCYLMLIHKSGLISSRQVLRKPDLYTQNHPLQLRMMLEENVLDKYLLVFRHFHWPAPRVLTKYIISFSHSCVYALHSLTKGKPFLPLPLAFLLSPPRPALHSAISPPAKASHLSSVVCCEVPSYHL